MSNPTIAMRIDNQPLDIDLLAKIVTDVLQDSRAVSSLLDRGFYGCEAYGSPITVRLNPEGKFFSVEPRDEPGWTVAFSLCVEYVRRSGIRLGMHDQEYSYFVCIHGDTTPEEMHTAMKMDPYQAERVMKEMGTWE